MMRQPLLRKCQLTASFKLCHCPKHLQHVVGEESRKDPSKFESKARGGP